MKKDPEYLLGLLEQFRELLRKNGIESRPISEIIEGEELTDNNFESHLEKLYDGVVQAHKEELGGDLKIQVAKCIYYATRLHFEASSTDINEYKKASYTERSTKLIALANSKDIDLNSYDKYKIDADYSALLEEHEAKFRELERAIKSIDKKNKFLHSPLSDLTELIGFEIKNRSSFSPDLEWDLKVMNLCIATINQLNIVLKNNEAGINTDEAQEAKNKLMEQVIELTKISDPNPDPNPNQTKIRIALCVLAYITAVTLIACFAEPLVAILVILALTVAILFIAQQLENEDNFDVHQHHKEEDIGEFSSSIKEEIDPQPSLYTKGSNYVSTFFSKKESNENDPPLNNEPSNLNEPKSNK